MQKTIQIKRTAHGTRIDYKLIYSLLVTVAVALLGDAARGTGISVALIIAAMPLVFSPEYLIGPIFFLSVFDDYLLAFSAQSFSRFFVYWFIIGTVFRLVAKKINIKIGAPVVGALLLGVLSVITSLDGALGYSSVPLSYGFHIVLFLCLVYTVAKLGVIKRQLWCFSALTVLYSIYFLLRNGIEVFSAGKVTQIEEGVNSNSLAMGLAVALVVIVTCFVTESSKYRLVNLLLCFMGLFSLFLTGSRSAMVGAVFGIALMLLIWLKLSGGKIVRATVLLILGVVVFLVAYSLLLEYVPEILEGFTVENIMETGGTGRIAIWQAFFVEIFPKHWFLGVGFDALNFYYAIEEVTGAGHGPHNILVEVLATMGVLGLALYVFCFGSSMKKIWRGVKADISLLLPVAMFLCCIGNGIGENIVGGRLIWLALGLGLLMLTSSQDGDGVETK